MPSAAARQLRDYGAPTMGPLAAISHATSPKTVVPVAWGTSLLLRRRSAAAEVAIGTSFAVLMADVLKHYISRRRPRVIASTPMQSFPSGHSAASTAYLVGLALLAPGGRRPLAMTAAGIGATAVNTVRVVTREHWLGDVIAGDAVGILAVAVAHYLVRLFKTEASRRST
jgi:membrane-associated phospholipid phosphatase